MATTHDLAAHMMFQWNQPSEASLTKIDAMNCSEDRVFAASLGNIEETIIPSKVLEVIRPEADKAKRQVFAPIFSDMTHKFFGDVYLS